MSGSLGAVGSTSSAIFPPTAQQEIGELLIKSTAMKPGGSGFGVKGLGLRVSRYETWAAQVLQTASPWLRILKAASGGLGAFGLMRLDFVPWKSGVEAGERPEVFAEAL